MKITIVQLRELTPPRSLGLSEGRQVAELQAARLLKISGIVQPPVPESIITGLPRLVVRRSPDLPHSGQTTWAAGVWLITLNDSEPLVRQRWTLMHEFKHVVDHPATRFAYRHLAATVAEERCEQLADAFAACVLMPKSWVKAAWGQGGIQDLRLLATVFGVSRTAMRIRLEQLGLTERRSRHASRRTA